MIIIKKLIAVIMLVISLFSAPKVDKIILSVVYTSPERVIIECENKTGRKISVGTEFSLEKKNGDAWEKLSFCENFSEFKDIICELMPTEKITFTVDAEKCFGKSFDTGKYRITVKAFMNSVGEIISSTEFEIK